MTYFFMMVNEEIDYRPAAKNSIRASRSLGMAAPYTHVGAHSECDPEGKTDAHLSEKPRFSKMSPSNRFMNKDMKSKSISPPSVAGR